MCKTWDRIRIQILGRHQNGKSDPDRHQNNVEPQHSLQQNKNMRKKYCINCICLKKNIQLLRVFTRNIFKGTVPRDFRLLVFFMNQFPPSPWVYHKAGSNFSKIREDIHSSRRCPWHRWQMEKIFNQKNVNYFVWTPLGSRVNIYKNFCPQVHLKVSAVWYCFHYLPLVSLTPEANMPPVSLTPVANLPPVSTTVAKLMAKFPAGVVDTSGAIWHVNISENFKTNSKRS